MPKSDLPADLHGRRSHAVPVTERGGRSTTIQEWVVDWWSGGGGSLGGLLRYASIPLEMGFRMVTGLWGGMYDKGLLPLQRAPVPVISVGNLTVGGSGKTPLASWLLRGLRDRGEKPALVARGYGEDELLLHRRWTPTIPIIAEEDRAFGAWKAARKGATVVVLDDGFQHRRLARELDVVLVAAGTPIPVRLLPRGPFREPLAGLGRAGVVVLTQKGREESTLEIESRIDPFLRESPVRVAFVADGWSTLAGEPAQEPDGDYLAVAGIGDPEGFFRVLFERTGSDGEFLTFPDHHAYGWSDVRIMVDRARGRPILTTEKDAVKLEAFTPQLGDVRVLRLRVEILEGEDRLWRHVEGVLAAGARTRRRQV